MAPVTNLSIYLGREVDQNFNRGHPFDVPEFGFGNMPEPRASRMLVILEDMNMDFGNALNQLKSGEKVAREGWNGKGMFLFLVPGSTFTVNRPPLLGIYPEGTEINYCPHIDMKTVDGSVVPWLASQTDVLAEDWTVVSG